MTTIKNNDDLEIRLPSHIGEGRFYLMHGKDPQHRTLLYLNEEGYMFVLRSSHPDMPTKAKKLDPAEVIPMERSIDEYLDQRMTDTERRLRLKRVPYQGSKPTCSFPTSQVEIFTPEQLLLMKGR